MIQPLFTPGKDLVPIVQEAGWAPGPVWTGVENLTPPGFDPRTVQPITSLYTDYATRPTHHEIVYSKNISYEEYIPRKINAAHVYLFL